jgi:hypothetical protein
MRIRREPARVPGPVPVPGQKCLSVPSICAPPIIIPVSDQEATLGDSRATDDPPPVVQPRKRPKKVGRKKKDRKVMHDFPPPGHAP